MHKKDAIREAQVHFLVCRVPAASPFFFEHTGASRRLAATANKMSPATAKNSLVVALRVGFWADLAWWAVPETIPRLPPNFGGLILEHRPPVVGCVPPPCCEGEARRQGRQNLVQVRTGG